MMLMKEKVLVTRKGGHWEGNLWVNDPVDPFPIRASVQPSPGEAQEAGEDGRRRKMVINVTTKTRLYAKDESHNGDLLTWEGEQYEVTAMKTGGKGTRLEHYKATAESLEDHSDTV